MGKKELAALFSRDPNRYYRVSLFDRFGFERQKCSRCEKFYWSITKRLFCPNHEDYGFIDDPPTNKKLDYIDAWKETEQYFGSHGHKIIRRYPVVCRWREDLYFTIASIVDFQRVVGNQLVFELPANPLVVPQICLRFNDIENVGISGRHYTGFCMIGQTCNADAVGGYWKDQCVDLDYGMLTSGLGINPKEITFVEDVWMGAGAFGYSLEYFVRGLELGNAVFTEFEGTEDDHRVMPNKIIDMGAGLERFSWITMGTPTSYDCCFGPVVDKLLEITGTTTEQELLTNYFKAVSSRVEDVHGDNVALKSIIAKELKIPFEYLSKSIAPYEAIYTVADHVRTLAFAISDGALPSNVGGGHNLRVILRRAISILERIGWRIKIEDIADMHIDYLRQMYPELEEHREDIRTILELEGSRYFGTRERMNEIATILRKKNSKEQTLLSVEELLRLYESDGITPDFLAEHGVIHSVPPMFYTKLSELHARQTISAASAQKPIPGLNGLLPTRPLYYEDASMREFKAKVLKVVLDGNYLVLDQTAFYPRGGGQEPDTGKINDAEVIEVTKQGDIFVHRMKSAKGFVENEDVQGLVNAKRRDRITNHHTATHVLNTSARNNLGSWVWQNSAFKEENYARLDITHHSALTREEVQRIERTANEKIRSNLPVSIRTYDRGEAEREYSFRIYQGGVVPSNNIRIVNIEGWDIEACGGTHVKRTGEIGIIKITKSERIQDGVVRLEYVAGEAALNYLQKLDSQLAEIAQHLGSSREKVVESLSKTIEEAEAVKKKAKTLLRLTSSLVAKKVCDEAKTLQPSGIKFYNKFEDELDEDYHIAVGEKAIEIDPMLIYIALISKGQGIRVIVFAGKEATSKIKAGVIAKQISSYIGGSGGGDERFGQGGGRTKDKMEEAVFAAEKLISTTG